MVMEVGGVGMEVEYVMMGVGMVTEDRGYGDGG